MAEAQITEEDFDPTTIEGLVVEPSEEDFDPTTIEGLVVEPSMTPAEGESPDQYKRRSDMFLGDAKEGPGTSEEARPSGLQAIWKAKEDLTYTPSTDEKVAALKDRLKESSSEEDKAVLQELQSYDVLKNAATQKKNAEPKSSAPNRATVFKKSEAEIKLEEAAPYIDSLFQKYIGENLAETEKGAQDYMFQASGPNAFRKTGEKIIPDNYKPGTNEYDQGPGKSDPWAWYNMLVEKAKTQGGEKTLTGDSYVLNDTVIPKPGDYDSDVTSARPGLLPGTVSTPYLKSTGDDAAREMIKNAATDILSLYDVYVSDGKTKYAEEVNNWIADPPKAKTIMSQLARDGTKIAASTLMGGAAASKVPAAVSMIPKVGVAGQKLAAQYPKISQVFASTITTLGGMLALTSAMNPDDPTLIRGKNALAPVLGETLVDGDADFATKHLAKRIDQFIDNLATSGTIPAAKATEVAAGWIYRNGIEPILLATEFGGSELRRQKKVVESMSKQVIADPTKDDFLKLADDADKNAIQKIVVEGRKGYEDLLKSQGMPVPEIVSDVEVPLTTMRSIAESNKSDPVLFQSALEADRSASTKPFQQYKQVSEAPLKAAKNFNEEFVETRGGRENLNTPGEVLSTDVMNSYNKKVDTIRDLTAEQKTVNDAIEAEYSKNPEYKSVIDGFLEYSGVGAPDSLVKTERRALIQKIAEGVRNMEEMRNKLFTEFPEGVALPDTKSFTNLIDGVDKSGNLTSEMSDWLKENGVRQAKNAPTTPVKPKYGQPAPPAVEAAPEISIDSRKVLTEFLPLLNKQISRLIGTPGANQDVSALLALRKNITDAQIEALSKSPDPAAKAFAEQYEKARVWYRDDYAPYANDPKTVVGQIFHAYHDTDETFRKQMMEKRIPSAEVLEKRGTSFRDTAQKEISGIADKQEASGQQFIKFLRREEVPNGADKDFFKVSLGDTVQKVLEQVRKAKLQTGDELSDLNPDELIRGIQERGTLLLEQYPEDTAKLNKFLTDISKLKADKVGFQKKLDEILLQAEAEQTNIEKGIASFFLEPVPDAVPGASKVTKYQQKGNPGAVLRELFMKENNENGITQILNNIKNYTGDPEVKAAALRGLQGSYIDTMREIMEKGAGKTGLNLVNVDRIINNKNSSFYKYGEQIFGNDSLERAEVEMGRKIYSLAADVERGKSVIASNSMPSNEPVDEAKEALGRMATIIFGVLTRPGAMTNAIGKRVIKAGSASPQHIKDLMDFYHSNPKEFARVARMIADDLKDRSLQRRTLRVALTASLKRMPLNAYANTQIPDGEDIQVDYESPDSYVTPEDKLRKAKVPEGVK